MGFFGKVFGGIKKVTKKIGGGIKKAIKFVAPKVLGVVQGASNILKHVHGTIGNVANLVNKGVNIAKDVIGVIPNKQVQNKLTSIVNQGGALAQQGLNKGTQLHKQIAPVIQNATTVANKYLN